MDMTINENIMQFLTLFLFILLPLILILIGVISGFMNGMYYILSIFWFGMGIIFYKALQ